MAVISGNGQDDVLSGSGVADTISGLGGTDQLFGGNGGDRLLGGLGNDLLFGGAGNDVLFGGIGEDSLFGGIGNDLVDLSAGQAGVIINLLAGTVSTAGSTAVDRLVSIESAIGTDDDDNILGDAGVNVLTSLDGDDGLYGRQGNDTLFGGGGDDRLFGGCETDRLFGGEDSDLLDGGDGTDSLDGGNGGDAMLGGGGVDTMSGGDDDDALFSGSGSEQVFGGNDDDLISGEDGSDRLFGGSSGDTVDGGEGGDTISGELGADLLGGRDGDDTIFGGAGNDVMLADIGDDVLTGNGPGIGGSVDRFAYGWELSFFYEVEEDHLFYDIEIGQDLGRPISDYGHDLIADFTPGQDKLAIGSIDPELVMLLLDADSFDPGSGSVDLFGNGNGVLDAEDDFVRIEDVTYNGQTEASLVIDVTGLLAAVDWYFTGNYGNPLDAPDVSTLDVTLFGVGDNQVDILDLFNAVSFFSSEPD